MVTRCQILWPRPDIQTKNRETATSSSHQNVIAATESGSLGQRPQLFFLRSPISDFMVGQKKNDQVFYWRITVLSTDNHNKISPRSDRVDNHWGLKRLGDVIFYR
jgi:hypothetical protein